MGTSQLVVDILARDKTAAGFRSAEHRVGGFRKALTLAGGALAGIGLAKFASDSVKSFQAATTEVSKLRRVAGGSPEDVSKLRYALKMSGVDVAAFTLRAGMLDKKIIEAGASAKKTAAMQTMLGTSIKDSTGHMRPLVQMLPDIAERFKRLGPGAESTALSLQLFGRSGQSLLPFLLRGKAGVEGLMNATDKSSIITQEQIDKNKAAMEAQRAFNVAMDDFKVSVGSDLIPLMTEASKVLGKVAHYFGQMPGPVKEGAVAVAGLALAYNFLSPMFGGLKAGIMGIARVFGIGTAATVADTVATNANTAAHVANGKVGGTVPGSFMRGGKSAAVGGLGVAEGAAGMGTGAFLAGLTVAIAAAIGATYVGTKEAAKHHAEQAPGVSGAAAGGIRYAGPSATDTQNVKARADAQFRLNDAIKSGVPNIDQQSQSYVKSSKAVGASTEGIREQLKQMGLTPRQIETAFKANPVDLNTKLKRAKGDLNGLKQSRVPAIRAQASQLNSQLKAAQSNVNRLKQKDPTNLKAIDLASAKVQTVANKIADLHDKDVTITATYTTYVNAVKGRAPATSHGGRATGGAGGGLAVVGERGPELVALPEGSWVYTHSQSRGMVDHFGTGTPLSKWKGRMSKALMPKLNKLKAARDAIKSDYAGRLSTFTGGISGYGGLGGMDFGAASDAASELSDAQRAYNQSAVGSADRSEAYTRLQAAKQKAADTPSTPLAWVEAKKSKLQRFANAITGLSRKLAGSKMGKSILGKQLILDVINAGPDGGTELGESLINGNELASVLTTMKDINGLTSTIATAGATADYAHAHGNQAYSSALASANNAVHTQQLRVNIVYTSKLILDGREIASLVHKQLLKEKRAAGGRSSGI